MKHAVYVVPLLVGMILNMRVALAQTDLPVVASPEWFSIFASQGLAVVLVFWWIAKGYPAWLKQWSEDLAKQREEFHGWRKEVADDLRSIKMNLDGRPCMLADNTVLSRLITRADEREEKEAGK